jgi:hypothetical protein
MDEQRLAQIARHMWAPTVAAAVLRHEGSELVAEVWRLRTALAAIARTATQDSNTQHGGRICRQIEIAARDALGQHHGLTGTDGGTDDDGTTATGR